ncbi:MAG: hypothetical protein GW859_00350 [Sphingomonadales bacterium]|nr:hypothetical protein [Sphingomonadales bacterium]
MSDGTIPQGGPETPAAPSGTPQFNEAERAAIAVAETGIQQTDPNNPAPPAGTPAAPQRPEGVPEKFWDAEKGQVNTEALLKSYTELEKSRGEAPKEPVQDGETPPARNDGKVEKTVAEQVEDAANDASNPALQSAIELAREQFATGQELGPEAYEALEKAGIPREMTDLYVAGLRAQTEQQLTQLHSFVEGKDNYEAMITWASRNLDDAGIDAFNTALDNPSLREFAVRDLYSKFSKANPSEGSLVAPKGGQAGATGDVYRSMDELVTAQMDGRYGTDTAYTQAVQEKVQRSLSSGIELAPGQRFARAIHTFE